MALQVRGKTQVSTGDYVLFKSEVEVEKHDTELRIAAGSVGRYIRQAMDPTFAVVLLANWHIRIPKQAISFLRPSNGPLPFPWVDNVIQKSIKWGKDREF